MSQQRAVVFDCEGAYLVGVAETPSNPRRTGLLVVTGGPQYRAGSHRQFALLCGSLASHNFASLRFDYRGSGDSSAGDEQEKVSFTQLQPDIAAAIGQLLRVAPEVSRIVLLGLCDGASAALMYAACDPRVAGVIMLNPWVRGAGSLEQARLHGYYPARLTSAAFWKRLISGKVNVLESLKSYRRHVAVANTAQQPESETPDDNFLQRMLGSAQQFGGKLLVVLSGQDMTAQEYRDLLAGSDDWRRRMSADNVQHCEIADANHTFASALWRARVVGHSLEFLQQVDNDAGPADEPSTD